MPIRVQPALTCQTSSRQIVNSDGRQWLQSVGSSSPARGCSGTSIGSRILSVTSSKHESQSSTSGAPESRSPIGRVRWYGESAAADS